MSSVAYGLVIWNASASAYLNDLLLLLALFVLS